MRLYEFEGKELLKKYGVPVPPSTLVSNALFDIAASPAASWNGVVVKAQLLSGRRGKHGAVRLCTSIDDARAALSMIGTTIHHEHVSSVLLEQRVDVKQEYYASLTFDTACRAPVMMLSASGGVDVEEAPQPLATVKIDPLLGLQAWQVREAASKLKLDKDTIAKLQPVLFQLYGCFEKEDAVLVEVNPLVETPEGLFVALDAHIELCDDGAYNHKGRSYPPRVPGFSRPPTEREKLVKAINDQDYRGTVKYLELDGDIAFLASGGGGSITCMDALQSCGGRPSNYTEFSGNPSTGKVYHLTKAVLSKPGFHGLWIVGAIANFTKVDDTMEGIAKALEETQPSYPIVVRRSGPNEAAGLQLLKDVAVRCNLDLTAYGAEMPMTKTAQVLMEKVNKINRNVQHGNPY